MNEKVLRTTIIYCWVVLGVSLILKLLGLVNFDIEVENKALLSVCSFIDSHMWLKMTLALVVSNVSSYFVLASILDVKYLSKKQLLVFIPLLCLKSIISWYNSVIAFILDLIILLVVTTIFNRKILRNIICVLIITAFQMIVELLHSLNLYWFNTNETIIALIMQIDYIIMVVLFYEYNLLIKCKKEKKGV